MAENAAQGLRDAIALFLSPIRAATTPGGAARLLRSVGHVGDVAGDPGLLAELRRIAKLADDIEAMTEADIATWEGLRRVVDVMEGGLVAVAGAEASLSDQSLRAQAAGLGSDLAERLTALYLRQAHPWLFRAAAVVGVVTPAEHADLQPMVANDGGVLARTSWPRDAIHPDRIVDLVRDPRTVLSGVYLPGGMEHATDAHAGAVALFPLLVDLASLGRLRLVPDLERVGPPPPQPSVEPESDAWSDWPPPLDLDPAPVFEPVDRSEFVRTYRPRLGVELPPLNPDGSDPARLGVALVASSAEHPDGVAGYIVQLLAGAEWTEDRGGWRISFRGDGTVPAVSVGPGGVDLGPGEVPGTSGTAAIAAERITAAGANALVLGGMDGSRLEVGALRLGGAIVMSVDRQAVEGSLDLTSAALVLVGGDGLLRSLLPSNGVRVEFDLGIVLSSDRGLELRSGNGLELRVAAGLHVGPVAVDEVVIRIGAASGGLQLDAGARVRTTIGPLEAVVEGIGLAGTVSFAPAPGSRAVDIGFKLPTGLGLVIDAGPVQGGGFLRFEPERGTYSGALELVVGRLEVKAFGLLTTRSDGYSLIIVMSAEFPEPIALPFGWRLAGVGGLIAIHHRLDTTALQAGLRTGVAGQLLFPADPITAAPQILTSLAVVFPPARGQFLIGPLFRLFWGAKGLATLSVAVVLELPDPVRVLILGRLEVIAPHREMDVLVLRVEFAGVADFQRPSFELDASIIDSHLGPFTLTGDVAVRMRGGEASLFLLTAGGFHPRFPIPTNANLPPLRRIAVALSSGDNPRARLELYTAITSSTWQIGGKLEVSASKAGFTAESRLSVDAIFGEITVDGRTRTAFLAEIEGRAAIKRGGTTIAGVGLTITLTGTEPWHVSGKAKISFFFFSVSIPFEGTFGDEPERRELPLIDAASLIRVALEDRANWETGLPSDAGPLVTLSTSPLDADEILAHPLGRVGVRQHAIPLGVELVRVGGARTAPDRYDVTTVTVGTETPPVTDLRSPFAAGQYLDLNEDERFTRPAFEPMISGFELTSQSVRTGPAIPADLTYEEFTIGPDGRAEEPKPGRPGTRDVFLHAATLGAAATTTLRRDERAGTATPDDTVRIRDLAPVVVDPVTLRTVALPGLGAAATYTEVAQAVARRLARGEATREDLVIVGAHEAVD